MAEENSEEQPRANKPELLRTSLTAALEHLRGRREAGPSVSEEPRQHLSIVPYKTPPPKVTITRQDLARHLMGLSVIYPARNSMSEAELTLRLHVFWEDLKGLSEGELSYACERYRKDPENKFFPHPGALLALAKF